MGTLLERVAAGDREAISRCVGEFGPLVWALVSRRLGRGADAEDLVQEILLEVWRHASRYDPQRSSEATFVAVIARRRLIDRSRRAAARPEDATYEIELPSEQQRQMEASVDARRVLKELESFPEEQKKVLMLATLNGLSHSEIAEHTKLPLGTVKTHVRRGLNAIRERLRSKSSEPRQRVDEPKEGA
ncbi:MAG: sigma-70 family RNA polymerase sigma factor [Myxococcales bacterium]|nr:sigma-70 family RNA polymerase sigma factor [Myxococcales bacterium]